MIEKLGNPEDAKVVIADLEKVREIITAPKNLVLHLAANLEDLPTHLKPDTPADVLAELLPSDVKSVVQKYVELFLALPSFLYCIIHYLVLMSFVFFWLE